MPLLAAFFGAAIVSFAEWLAKFFAKRVAMAVAVFGVLFASFAAVLVAVHSALSVLVVVTPPTLTSAFALLFPANIQICISAYYAVYGIMTGWQWHRENIKLAAHYIT
jgi:hypothetical protein